MPDDGGLGLTEVIALGVGGLIGGGIFAVLGVAAKIAGNTAFLSYLASGLIATFSAYSYARMTGHLHEEGGSFTFLEHYVENNHIAGMVGWVLIVGYVGTMAMYSFAFGAFAVTLLGVEGLPFIRPVLSIGVLVLFIGINLLGVEETGASEDLLVYAKVAILLLFGAVGIYGIVTRPDIVLFKGGLFNNGMISPLLAIGAIFVSFEGFQLLTYEFSEIRGGVDTLTKGVLASVVISTLIYMLVAFVTTNLVPAQAILQHKETILAYAAGQIFSAGLINQTFFVLVAIAALFSTASAINATLFGTARLSYRIATDNELPQVFSFRNREGIPSHALLIIGGLTAVFTGLGTLEQITTFASVAFLIVFGIVNWICFRDPEVDANNLIPLLGFIGTAVSIPLMIWHFYRTKPGMLVYIGVIFAVLLVLEFLYIEREQIEEDLEEVEHEVEGEIDEIEHEVEDLADGD